MPGCLGGDMRGCSGGHAWLLWGGMVAPGEACMVAPGGHAWLLWGGAVCVVAPGGCMVALGGHAWLLWGVCMVARGGACMGYNEIRRYGQ